MANIIDENGITIKTLAEIKTELTDDLKLAYGDDINVASDTPDGQAINIFALAVKDVEDLLVQVYNSMNPDNAIGRTLDQRVAINGIQRKGGTYSTCDFSLTISSSVTLVGLDSSSPGSPPSGIHTISDSEGNYWYLTTSQTLSTVGAHVLNYTSKIDGAVLVTAGQSMRLVTVQLGVLSVATASTLNFVSGLAEETDTELRLRRQQSVSLASQGYLASLKAALKNISGVTYSEVYENNTSGTDSRNIPSHSLWAIVENGTDADIAYEIYTKRNAGCGMRGNEVVNVTQPDGSLFQIKFDRTTTQPLYVQFSAHSISGITLDTAYIKSQLVALLSLEVSASVNANDIAALIREIDSNCLATNIKVSNNGSTWVDIVDPTALNYRFTLVTGNITINVV